MLDYIRSLLSFIFAISSMYMLLDCKINTKRDWYLLGLYVSVILFLDGIFLLHFGYDIFMTFYPLLVHLPVFIAFVFLSKFKSIKVFFILWTLVAISTSFSMVGLSLSFLFNLTKDAANIICYVLYLPTWYLLYKYIRPSFLHMLRNSDKGWLGFSMIPITYSALIYSIGMYKIDEVINQFSVKYGILLFIMVFSVYFLILQFFAQTREQLILQNEQTILLSQVSAAKLHFEALEDSQEKTLMYRHDMRHHLNLIKSFLIDNNNVAAQKYIDDVERDIEEIHVEQYCNNYTVNLILYSYIMHAQKKDIRVETQIDLPEDNHVSDMDLCVIFGNIIENAIHACEKLVDPNHQFIRIICKIKNSKVFIQISNSYQGDILFSNDKPVSMEENHGLGTKSIAAIADKYKGIYSFVAENDVFTVSLIL